MDDQKFSIYDVKKVKTVYGERLVNSYIDCGWILLSTAMESIDGDVRMISALGAPSKDIPEPESNSPMKEFLAGRRHED